MSRKGWSLRAGRVTRRSLSSLLDGVLGVVWFTWVVTMLSLGAGLAITLLGVPLLAVTVRSGRVVGAVERARVRWWHQPEVCVVSSTGCVRSTVAST